MTLFIIFILNIVAVIYTVKTDRFVILWMISSSISILCGVFLMVGLNSFIQINGQLQEIESVRQTIKISRENHNLLENTALQLEVIKANREIASLQYYNKFPIFKDFIPDTVDTIKLIE